MKRNFTFLLTGLALFSATSLFSQEIFSCGTATKLQELYSNHPELEMQNQQLLLNAMQLKQQRDGSTRTIFTIPVVFHVIHEYGSENITDAQIYDQMAILNRDYRKLNTDISDVVPEFDTLIADCNIEFKLATIDYAGNCTNGIEHIYSHEANIGDDYSKINQWPRNKYLNVWVVKSMQNGVAGYAYYPSAVEGALIFADGIIILNDYIGSIGTSSVGRSRALTHEIGHWLGLSHTWGNTNDPMVACGDDGMNDTPVTRGFNFCPGANYQTTAALCTPGVVENFQNYMEYSYCSRMFTPDQAFYMNYTLQNSTASRDNLVSSTNHTETGINVSVLPLCSPVADFYVSNRFICNGESVTFNNASWRASVDTYSWSFPTGTPSASNSPDPTVTFNSPGYHNASLTVTNAAGSDTKTINAVVWVSYPWVDNAGPKNEDFESETADDWLVNNPENNNEKWQLINNIGYNSNHCYKLNNYYNGNIPWDPFYQNKIGGNKDGLISPAFDLSNTASATLSFNYSCATFAPSQETMTDELKIYSTIDCGKTWVLRKTISGTELMTAGFASLNYIPNNTNQWGYSSISLGASVLQPNVRFKFEYYSSDYANNLYIDNVNLNGVLGTEEIPVDEFTMNIYPNPATRLNDLFIQCTKGSDMIITITDINGKVIYSENHISQNSGEIRIGGSKLNLQSGIYLVSLSDERGDITKKLVVL